MKLLRSILEDVHLCIALLVAAGLLAVEIWGLLHDVEFDKVRTVLLVMMIAILCLTIDGLKTSKQRRQMVTSLEHLERASAEKRVALHRPPQSREDYFRLWGNFTGRYFAYSPAYRVEQQVAREKDIIELYVRRYQDSAFEGADYLFLTGDEEGRSDLAKFRTLMVEVAKRVKCEKKIRVRELAEAAEPSAEIYIGSRNGRRNAIIEMRDPALGQKHGIPLYYCVLEDAEIIENHVKVFFDREWQRAKDVPLFA
jgi:hypothetical protein